MAGKKKSAKKGGKGKGGKKKSAKGKHAELESAESTSAKPPVEDRFPFIGAGDAAYFEWAELFVRFLTAPTAPVRRAIAERVPPPLRDTIEWDESMLWVASEQGVGRHIKNAYGKKKGKGVAALTSLTKFAQAGGDADAMFNAHIEAWLRDAHRRCPILVAYRRQDFEAGGTELSDWHRSSIRHVQEAADAMAAEPTASDAALVERLIEWATDEGVRVKKTVPKVLRDKARAAEEAELAAADAEEKERAARASSALRTPKGYDAAKLPRADEARLLRALDDLAKRLPKTAKRLKRIAPTERHLRPGASKSAIAAAEKKMGVKLSADARALLKAFDGGVVGDVVILGTEAGGAKGADDIAVFAQAHDWDAPIVARTGLDRVVFLESNGAPLCKGAPGAGSYSVVKSFKKLDAALEHVLKKRSC